MTKASCLRSGFCCKQATCQAGVNHGAPQKGCTFLEGSRPGEYSCRLVKDKPEFAESMAIGAGCTSTSFNEDRRALGAPLTWLERVAIKLENKETRDE
jgi:hypothetical protein